MNLILTKYKFKTICFFLINLLSFIVVFSCQTLSKGNIDTQEKEQYELFPKMERGVIKKNCYDEKSLGKQSLFLGINKETEYLNGNLYNPFIISQYENKVYGYLRKDKNVLYYLPKGFGRENECNDEIVFLKFNTKKNNQWHIDCLDAITDAQVTFEGLVYNNSINDSLHHFSIKPKIYPPHISSISDLYVDEKHGFVSVILSEPSRDTLREICNFNLID